MKLALLLGTAVAPLILGGVAVAQDVGQADRVDEIVVTGRRPIAESEAAALQVQRNSDSLVSVIASDAVGRLPDQNVAQAIARIPGAAVESDQGQPRYISLRGAPKNWTTLSLNGIGIVSPEGRDTRYDSLPSAIASQIIVNKAVTPDLNGETIAGNIDIITRSAFDYSGLHLAGKLGAGIVELGDRNEYEGQLVASDRFDTGIGEIGILASGSYYERNMVTDNYEIDWELVPQDVQPGGFGATTPGDRLWARETENKLYRLTRTNYSRTGRIDWRPNDTNRIFLESIFTTFQDDEARDNFLFDTDDRQADASVPPRSAAAPCTVTPTGSVSNTGYADTCIGNTSLVGTVYGIDLNQRATLRAYEQSIFTTTLGGEHEIGAWNLDWRANFTRSIDDRSVVGEARYESPSARNQRVTIAYDFTDVDLHNIQLYRTLVSGTGTATRYSRGDRVTNIDDFVHDLTQLTSLKAIDETEAYTGRFDLSRELDWLGAEAKITFGGQYDQRTKESNENQLSLATSQRRPERSPDRWQRLAHLSAGVAGYPVQRPHPAGLHLPVFRPAGDARPDRPGRRGGGHLQPRDGQLLQRRGTGRGRLRHGSPGLRLGLDPGRCAGRAHHQHRRGHRRPGGREHPDHDRERADADLPQSAHQLRSDRGPEAAAVVLDRRGPARLRPAPSELHLLGHQPDRSRAATRTPSRNGPMASTPTGNGTSSPRASSRSGFSTRRSRTYCSPTRGSLPPTC